MDTGFHAKTEASPTNDMFNLDHAEQLLTQLTYLTVHQLATVAIIIGRDDEYRNIAHNLIANHFNNLNEPDIQSVVCKTVLINLNKPSLYLFSHISSIKHVDDLHILNYFISEEYQQEKRTFLQNKLALKQLEMSSRD